MGNTVQDGGCVTTQGNVVTETALKAPWQSQCIIKAPSPNRQQGGLHGNQHTHTFIGLATVLNQ